MTPLTTISSRAFNQYVGSATHAAEASPVVITDRGRPAFVLLRYAAYQQLAGERPSIRQLLDQPGVEDIDFDPPRLGDGAAPHSGVGLMFLLQPLQHASRRWSCATLSTSRQWALRSLIRGGARCKMKTGH